jgi:asparagine synthase (glutamine-hydrolysing)
MSSICGLCRPEGPPVDGAEIDAMLHALDYWGADARGAWTTGHAGLGHLLLRTTPASPREALPVTDEEAGITITGDCRLDNRNDVAGRLGVGAGELVDCSDTHLALRAYRHWGEQCVTHLLGDFAFAVWDSRRRQLFCARDRFGVKPLYYHARGGLLAFASEMKGLLALPDVDRTVDETWIADYLHRLGLDNETTFYAGIRRLPQAHALTFGAAGLRTWRYWALDTRREVRLPRESDYVEAFREKLDGAIRRRCQTPFELGAELSGGLDSTAICIVAQGYLREQGRDLQTFSQVHPEGTPEQPGQPIDMRWAIDLVCRHAGIVRPCFLAGEGGVLPALEWASRYYDEPPRTLVSVDNYDLYEAAAARDVRVLLSGFGGNFGVSASGRGRLRELIWSGQWPEFRSEVAATAPQPLDQLVAGLRAAFGWLDGPALDFMLRRSSLWQAHPTRPTRRNYARRVGIVGRTFRHARRYSARGNLRQMTAQLLDVALAERLEAAHVPAAARRMEYRYPLLDLELVELFQAMPSDVKFRGGRDRYLFRQSLEGRVPESVRLYAGPRGSANPAHPLRRQRDEGTLKAMIGRIAPGDPVLAYLDLEKLAAEPRIRGRVARARHTEMMMALLLAGKLGQARPAQRRTLP